MRNYAKFLIMFTTILLLTIIVITSYSTLKMMTLNVSSSINLVNIQIEKRTELLNGLIDTMDQNSKQDADIIGIIREIQEKINSAQTLQEKAIADYEMSAFINEIINYANQNPSKTNDEFKKTLSEISVLQTKISVAKSDYNNIVEKYNADINGFPLNIFSKIMSLENAEYFKTE